MEANRPSWTALVSAFFRAYHYAYDEPKIFKDQYAHLLLTDSEVESIEWFFIDFLTRLDPAFVESCPDRHTILRRALRISAAPATVLALACYAEEKLSEMVLRGISQYVLIGAGLDTIAFRWPELRDRLRVFEIDHPATQDFKRQRLAQVGLEAPPNLHFSAANLECENLARVLSRLPYKADTPALFAWLGVTTYLTHSAIIETLRSIRSIAVTGSQLVFDYMETDALTSEKASERIQRMMRNARRHGEPMLSGFDPCTLGTELARLGFCLLEDLGPQDQEARYFRNRTDDFHATEHFHLVCVGID
jgi:methyltransferase (TIGR00027 family)